MRLVEHHEGMGSNYTEKRRPVRLVYCKEFPRIEDAYDREKQIQGWSRKKKEALIKDSKEELPELSKNYTEYPR